MLSLRLVFTYLDLTRIKSDFDPLMHNGDDLQSKTDPKKVKKFATVFLITGGLFSKPMNVEVFNTWYGCEFKMRQFLSIS